MSPEDLVALQTILRKEINRFSRIWTQTLMPSVVTSILYFAIFGSLIGNRIGTIQGFSYMQFIVPGIVMMAVITNSYGNVAFSFYSAKFQRSIEEIQVAPVTTNVLMLGYLAGGMVRGLCVGILVALVASFFVTLQVHSWGILVLSLLLTSLFFSLCGLLNAIYADSFDSINIVPTFILTPLNYLGGIFYSISMLPIIWQKISYLNPLVYMISGVRFGFWGTADVAPMQTLALLTPLTIALYALCWKLIEQGTGLRS